MIHIKICGLKTLEEALAAVEAGADLVGFNFYPPSVRHIEPQACREITAVLRERYPHVKRVGVFVNASAEAILDILQGCSLHLAQLHGDEPPALLDQLASLAFKAWRGIPPEPNPYPFRGEPALLLDAAVAGSYGGTGLTADWSSAARLAKQYPLLLAGGLNPQNVAEAVRQVGPWGVDVASGVEASPGVKDIGKMKAFVQAVRRETIRLQDYEKPRQNEHFITS